MTHPPVALSPLEPGQRTLMQLGALFPSVLLIAGAIALATILHDRSPWTYWPIMMFAVVVALWMIFVAPRRRWAAWGWALSGDELHVAHGIWTKTHTIVPLGRVQHIDVAQGPLERSCGVARLVLHTAGTAHATVVLPGVTRDTAESLRDTIRTHIRADLW